MHFKYMYTPYLQDPQQLQQQQQQQPTITTKYMHFLYNFNKLLENNPSLDVFLFENYIL